MNLSLAAVSTRVLTQLANPAARALVVSAVAGLGLAAFRVKATSVRLFTWSAVLYAALAMPLLEQMLPPMPIPSPEFLQHAVFHSESANVPGTPAAVRFSIAPEKAVEAISTEAQTLPSEVHTGVVSLAAASSQSSIRWTVIAAGVYLAITVILLARFLVGLSFGGHLMRAARTIGDPRVAERLALRARASGIAFIPRAAESELISVPLTMGALRSTILLPTGWREWDDAKLDAVIVHEMSHVARRDGLTQRLSLLHRAIFWFSPLSWWLDQRLADLAEQASDEAALSCGTDRKDYARILLGFFEVLHAAPGRVRWLGVSMGKAGQAEQRLERVLTWKGSVAMRLKKSIALVVVAFAIPAVYLAAAARPAHHVGVQTAQAEQKQKPQSPQSPSAPNSAPVAAPDATAPIEPGPSSGVISGTVSGEPTPPPAPPVPEPGITMTVIAPALPVHPASPTAPMPPPGGQSESRSSSERGFSYHYGFDDEQRFVIVSGKTDSLTMSGSAEDARHVEKLRKQIPGDFIWFQRDEKSYVIRDQATIDRARKLWAPQEELGKKQEALGKQQEALGKQQEELGAKMEQIHVKLPDMTADLDKLKAELKQLSSGATSEQVGHLQSEIGELQSRIGELESHAGDQQGKLGEEMGALGEKQGKLGAQQGELGRQQAELAEQATRQMKQLLDEAITKGIAQPEL